MVKPEIALRNSIEVFFPLQVTGEVFLLCLTGCGYQERLFSQYGQVHHGRIAATADHKRSAPDLLQQLRSSQMRVVTDMIRKRCRSLPLRVSGHNDKSI